MDLNRDNGTTVTGPEGALPGPGAPPSAAEAEAFASARTASGGVAAPGTSAADVSSTGPRPATPTGTDAAGADTRSDRGRGWLLAGVACAAGAMFLVGTLASVSALIADYPVYGGQAVRYAVAAAILLVVARVLGPAPGRAGTPDRTSGRAQTSGRTEASGRTGASRRARASGPAEASSPAGSSGQAEAGGPAEASRRARASGRTEASGRTGARGRVRLGRRELALLGALSATGLVIFNVAVIESARAAGPTLAGTVLGTVPLALALAGGGRPSPRLVAAATVVVAGATLATGLGSGNAAGLAWALVALACEVCFSLLALPLLPTLGAVRVSAYSSALAVPLLVVIGLAVDGGGFLRAPTAPEALGLGYLSLVITTIAFLLWYTGLPRLGPQRAGLFAGLIPVGAIVTTVVLGLGTPGPADLAGAALVIAGIVMGLYGGVVPSRKT